MNNDFSSLPPLPTNLPAESEREPDTQGMSALYKLFEAFISLREKNERQHRLFEQSLTKVRETFTARFNDYAKETQRAFQNLRQELTGEKRVSLSILNELLEICLDLERIVASKPMISEEGEINQGIKRWAESIEVQTRRVQDSLVRHGIHPYDAVVGTPYNPALHERVGTKRAEGMDALRIAEQREHGFASQHPEFILRRPKVIVSE